MQGKNACEQSKIRGTNIQLHVVINTKIGTIPHAFTREKKTKKEREDSEEKLLRKAATEIKFHGQKIKILQENRKKNSSTRTITRLKQNTHTHTKPEK